jgi:hypothetical protein
LMYGPLNLLSTWLRRTLRLLRPCDQSEYRFDIASLRVSSVKMSHPTWWLSAFWYVAAFGEKIILYRRAFAISSSMKTMIVMLIRWCVTLAM